MIEVKTSVNASPEECWEKFTHPDHIIHWNAANEEWHCPSAASDLVEGGMFSYRMEARDGSMGFDYEGVFDRIEAPNLLHFHLDDGRKVEVEFVSEDESTLVIERFEEEKENDVELQRQGWQAILNNYASYVNLN